MEDKKEEILSKDLITVGDCVVALVNDNVVAGIIHEVSVNQHELAGMKYVIAIPSTESVEFTVVSHNSILLKLDLDCLAALKKSLGHYNITMQEIPEMKEFTEEIVIPNSAPLNINFDAKELKDLS